MERLVRGVCRRTCLNFRRKTQLGGSWLESVRNYRSMLTGTNLSRFRKKLLGWFTQFQRDLPWRRTKDPYRIWLSEIMLQQTRVAAVIPYYERFLQHFPDVKAVAEAPEQEVLRHWAGLGYYSRARNLQKAARQIVAEHGSRFPDTPEKALRLSGIGRIHGSGNSEYRVWKKVGGARRKRGQSDRSAGCYSRRLAIRFALANIAGIGRRFARTWRSRRLESGHDGVGRNDLHAAVSTVSAVSSGRILPGAEARSRRHYPGEARQACARGNYDSLRW